MKGYKPSFTHLFLFLTIFYFLSRLLFLQSIPIFNDESIYIRYGLHQINDPELKPYSLLIDKEPLMPFLYAWFGSMSSNLLIGARIVSILFGFFTLLGLFKFVKEFASKRAAIFTVIFYIAAPYVFFFDRLALLDNSVNTIGVWTLYYTYKLTKQNKWRYGLSLGIITGIGLWIKSTDFFYLLLPVIAISLYALLNKNTKKIQKQYKIIGLSLVVALLLFIPLYTNPYYAVHMQLTQQYIYPLNSVFSFPINLWFTNFSHSVQWLFFYLTPLLFITSIFSFYLIKKDKKYWLVFLWLIVPLIYEVLYAKKFTSRYVLLLVPPLLIFASCGLDYLASKKEKVVIVLTSLIIAWCLFYNFFLYTNPQMYPNLYPGAAKNDLVIYFYSFSSGYGVKEAVDYLQTESLNKNIIITIRNDHGNPEDAIVAYFLNSPNVKIIPMNDPSAQIGSLFAQVDPQTPVYYVTRGAYYAGMEKYIAHEVRFNKPNDTEFVGVSLLKRM